MRNRQFLLIFSAIAALSLSACDDDDLDANTDATSDGAAGSGGSAGAAGEDSGAGDSGNADSGEDGGAADGGEADSGEDGGAADGGDTDGGDTDGGDTDGGDTDGGDTDGGDTDGGDADGGEVDSGEDGGAADGGNADSGEDGSVVPSCATACAKFNDCSAACSQNLVELCLTACEESQAAALNAIEQCGEAITALDLVAQCAFHVDLGETCDANHLCNSPAECMDGTCRQHVGVGETCDDDNLCSSPAECVDGACRQQVDVGEDCDANRLCGSGVACHQGVCKTLVGINATCDEEHICAGLLQCSGRSCKRPGGYLYGECSSSDECLTGTCQQDSYGNGPYCLLNIGDTTHSAETCVSYAASDGGLCAMPFGGACSRDLDCDSHASCVAGTCKRKLSSDGNLCYDSTECPTGASCQKNRYGDGPWCLLDGGEVTTDASHCASYETYDDNGTTKCKSLVGGNCASNANLCTGRCEGGTCKRLGRDGGLCSDNDECAAGTSCQKAKYGRGPYCLLEGGQRTAGDYNCASGLTYEVNGVTKCRALLGSDCSQNPQFCPDACDEDGICKKLGSDSGECSSNDECPTGASCQMDREGRGPFCLLDGGQKTSDSSHCASLSTYEENGVTKCKALPGSDCFQNPQICAGACEDGICKKLGSVSGVCSSNDECATGASCQMDREGRSPFCLLDGGQETESGDNCVSSSTYREGSIRRCTYLSGGNCSEHSSICAGSCKDGTCRRLGSNMGICSNSSECVTGASCQMDWEGRGPFCLLDSGQETMFDSYCASGAIYEANGTGYCKSLLGGNCSSNPDLCTGRCDDGICKKLDSLSGYCSDDDECAAGASCQKDISGYGPYCLLNGGQETTDYRHCASTDIYYDDNGKERCTTYLGGDCTSNPKLCTGRCDDGTCKRFGSSSGECSSNDECAAGASCQRDRYGSGPYCLLDGGQESSDFQSCASSKRYFDGGWRCAYLTGGDCSKNINICQDVCENGTCKLLSSGFCSDSSDCALGAFCGGGEDYPYCFLDDGTFISSNARCASGESHLDNGLPVCGPAE